MGAICGREKEIDMLDELLKSKSADLLVVYGRRRVGKTFIIQTYLHDHMVFHLTGMYQAGLKEQLQQFSLALQQASRSAMALRPPLNWIDAFQALQAYLSPMLQKKKLVVFLDEFPWLDGRKSGFLSAFEHFWNNWASRQPQLLMVVCGSSASWMLSKIINNKGGLHNRITAKMPLAPFTLAETEEYLKSTGCKLDRYQILQVYMAFGGIPHYLKTVGKDKSAAQVIERTCFSRQGLLTGEFDNLYNSLFELADNHIKVVRALAAKGKGYTRQELITVCGLSSGGRATVVLEELEKSGFIQATVPYGKIAKDVIYRLIDEFSIFYLKFMDKRKRGGKDVWARISEEPSYAIWCGIAFEAVCLKHVEQIMEGLKIRKGAEIAAWRYVPAKGSKEKGAQIDLIIDRKDLIINICEMKFYNKPFVIDKKYAQAIQQKMDVFTAKMKPRKTLFVSMITTYGIADNAYADQLVQQQVNMNVLFKTI